MAEVQGKVNTWWAGARVDAGACALLLLLALVFMSPGLPPGRVAAPMEQILVYLPWASRFPDASPYYQGGDLLMQQLPWRHWEQNELAAGRFPLWASGPLGGSPLFADYQPGVLYPLHLLWILMPVGAGLGIIMALKLWLTGVGMWGLLRAIGIHPSAALLGAFSLMFSTWMVDLLAWQLTGIYLLLPWMFWAALAWGRGSRAAVPSMAVLVAFAVFAGHPELLFMVGATVGMWVLALGIAYPRRAVWTLIGMAVAAVLGFALGAVQFLPFLEVLGLSHTSAVRTFASSAGSHLEADMLLYWLFPRFWSYPPEGLVGGTYNFVEVNGYIGLAPLMGIIIAGVGVVRGRVNLRLFLPCVLIGLISFILAYDGTLGTIIRSLPGFNQNVNVRWVAILAFALVLVGAFGWDRLARWVSGAVGGSAPEDSLKKAKIEAGKVLGIGGASLFAIGVGIMLAHWLKLFPQPVLVEKISIWYVVNDSYRGYWAIWSGGMLLATLGAAGVWASGRRLRVLGPLLLGLVMLADLWTLLMPVNGTAPAQAYFPQSSFIMQVKSLVPTEERVIPVGEALPANSGLVLGIRDWRSQDALTSERAHKVEVMLYPDMTKNLWSEYNQFLYSVRPEVAVMLGVRYFIHVSPFNPNASKKDDPAQPDYTRLANKDGLGLWRAEGVPGFSYLSDNVQLVDGEKSAASWLNGVTWEQARSYSAMVEAPPGALADVRKDLAGSSPGGTTVEEYTPGHIRVRVNALRPALLVVAESWYPGWRASLDKQSVAVLRANYLSQGVVVPAGEHTVELDYRPDSFRYGLLISLGGLVVLITTMIWATKHRRATSDSRQPSMPVPSY